MSIEQRLTDHMAEQAERLAFPNVDPGHVIHRPWSRGGHVVTTVTAALVVVVVAGLGFLALGRDGGPTEIAAIRADGSSAEPDATGPTGDESGGDGTAIDGFVGLTVSDVTDESSPGNGRVEAEGGVYYVLSTAPGRIRMDTIRSDEEWARLGRPRTFYTYAGDSWEVAEVADRFVSDFDVEDGVIYVLSTGGLSGNDTAAMGTSSDRGRSWDWEKLPDLPPASRAAMLRTDGSAIILLSRWGNPDPREAVSLAREAGVVEVTTEGLRDLSPEGFAYVPIDPSDPCSRFAAEYGLDGFVEWLRTAPPEEQPGLEEEVGYLAQEASQQGCVEFDPGDLSTLDLASPIRKSWSDLGVEIPESWTPFTGLYRWSGGELTELDHPIGTAQINSMSVSDGQLVVSAWDPSSTSEAELRFTTTDGVSWSEETITYPAFEEGQGCCWVDGPSGTRTPSAGESTFRVFREEPDERVLMAFDQAMSEATSEAESEAIAMEFGGVLAGVSRLQRSVAGGPWEDVPLDDLVPDVELDGRMVNEVRGSAYGVFVFLAPAFSTGPDSSGSLVLYSNNGVDWASFQSEGDWLELHDGDGDILAFDNIWTATNQGATLDTRVLLLTPGG